MTEAKQLPVWACELFRNCDDGRVRWITEDERLEALKRLSNTMPKRDLFRFRNKLIPAGCVAGAREVHGHGQLVTVTSCLFTTQDVRAMLADGGRWPWEAGARTVSGMPSENDAERLETIRECMELRGDRLFWRVSPHSTIPAGSPVAGAALVDGRRVVMRGGCGFLISDVVHALQFGNWPWLPAWD